MTRIASAGQQPSREGSADWETGASPNGPTPRTLATHSLRHRCQNCEAVFQGYVCPRCGEDHAPPEPPTFTATELGRRPRTVRRCGCGEVITHGNARYCAACRKAAHHEASKRHLARFTDEERRALWRAQNAKVPTKRVILVTCPRCAEQHEAPARGPKMRYCATCKPITRRRDREKCREGKVSCGRVAPGRQA